ncbi:MAG: phosphoglucosamine mutase [Haloplanus sp.]
MQLFGSSGTRGVVGEEFTPELVRRVASGAAAVWDADRVAVARDTRLSGGPLADVAAGTLASAGADVDRLGVVPTPGVAHYCASESVPAVLLTASHNPPAYNGIKLLGADGTELSVDAYERVEERVLAETEALAPWDGVGTTRRVDGVNADYRADLLAGVDREAIRAADLTVALDPGHGAGSLVTPGFVRELGCAVRTVNADPDGHFPGRDPEPVAENLTDLQRLVRSTDADVGIAHDGDADRAIFVDERGEFVDGDASLAALAAAELAGETGDGGSAAAAPADDAVVAAVNVSQRLVDVVEDAGAELDLTPIGSTHIVTRIRERQRAGDRVPIAGEGNGGVFFPGYRLTRDGAYTAAKFLERLAHTGETASELIEPYTDYHLVRENVTYDTDAELDRILGAAEAYARDADAALDTTDGYRLDYGDAWLLVRPSGTEPKVRIYAEARDPDRATDLAADLYRRLDEARD